MIRSLVDMMPTLEQISRLSRFLLDIHGMGISPEVIKFSREDNRPFIIISVEPIHEIKRSRWFTIDWKGVLKDEEEKPIL